MSYAKDVKVLCQIKAWLVVRWRGRESGRVWHQMMLSGGGGWPGTAHTGLHSEGNGNPWKNLSGEET